MYKHTLVWYRDMFLFSVNRNIAPKARHLAEDLSPPPGGYPRKRCSDYGAFHRTKVQVFESCQPETSTILVVAKRLLNFKRSNK